MLWHGTMSRVPYRETVEPDDDSGHPKPDPATVRKQFLAEAKQMQGLHHPYDIKHCV